MSQKSKGAQGSMSQLRDLVSKAGIHLKREPESKKTPLPEKNKPVPPAPKADKSDDELFSEAMGGVDRIPWK